MLMASLWMLVVGSGLLRSSTKEVKRTVSLSFADIGGDARKTDVNGKLSLFPSENKPSTNSSFTQVELEWSDKPRKILHVHVGKAGGNTIRLAFPRLRCKRLREVEQQDRCFQKRSQNASQLSLAFDAEMHMTVGPRGATELANYTTFMFSMRNPITRAISAYQYLHHDNIQSAFARSKHPLKEEFYKKCFPTLQHLLNALNKVERIATKYTNSSNHGFGNAGALNKCQHMAITVLEGENPRVKHINVHLRDNYQFYHNRTLAIDPKKEVFVIRTELLWNDMIHLDQAMGGTGQFSGEGNVANKNRKTAHHSNDPNAAPTTQQLRNLCCILWKDTQVYQDILNLGVNLHDDEKLQSMQNVWKSCNIGTDDVQKYSVAEDTNNETGVVKFSWAKWHEDNCPDISRII